METWYREHGEAINILLFPSDEFGGQELPEAQIPAFVKGKGLPTDGGGCHLMAKVRVNGPEAEPVWQMAKAAFPGEVRWNFAGIFLFDKDGAPVGRFTAQELPKLDKELKALLSMQSEL